MRAFGNLMNRVMEDYGKEPKVGMGCTILMFSDRHACTIIEVVTPKKIIVQRDLVERLDNNGMSDSQHYDYTIDLTGETRTFTLRKNGRWVEEGGGLKNGTVLMIGERDEHYDYSF